MSVTSRTGAETGPDRPAPARRRAVPSWVVVAGPLVAAAVLLVVLVQTEPLSRLREAPPLDAMAVERTVLDRGVIRLHVRNDGTAAVTIAQVMVDDAFWQHTAEPRTLGRLDTARVTIPYPWEEGQPLRLALLTSTGVRVEHEIAAATLTPDLGVSALADYALAGVAIGVVPVALGLLWLPALRRARRPWLRFFLAFTVGLLAFLLAETTREGLEQAGEAPARLLGVELFAGGLLVVVAAIAWLNHALSARGGPEGLGALGLAYLVALGIGLHNLGEGLAVASAVATGEVALGTALLVGFAAHNTTEGLAIASPLGTSVSPGTGHLVALALVAGGPTVLGAWAGAFAVTPAWAALAFGVAAGAIVSVIAAVGRALVADGGLDGPAAGGFAVGVVTMYATGLVAA
jgi:ZIP family zinc transporter